MRRFPLWRFKTLGVWQIVGQCAGRCLSGAGLSGCDWRWTTGLCYRSDKSGYAIPQADKDKYNLQVEILEGNTYSLTNGNKGYVRMISQVGRWTFVEPKYYYTPIATEDLIYNPNLIQNKYWAE